MMQNKEEEKVHEFMARLYNDDTIIQARIQDLHNVVNESSGNGEKPSIGNTFCGDQLRYASLLGVFFGIAQQLTGINVVMFYSSTIF